MLPGHKTSSGQNIRFEKERVLFVRKGPAGCEGASLIPHQDKRHPGPHTLGSVWGLAALYLPPGCIARRERQALECEL